MLKLISACKHIMFDHLFRLHLNNVIKMLEDP